MKQKKLISQLREIREGRLEGGFALLNTSTVLIIGGTGDPANNCQGGNCTNNCNSGNCGNCVQGCGSKG